MPGVFDIIGPVMVGPSSSHTAGAARLGRMARVILNEQPAAAEIELHGSFARTYRGHGTDKALVAGLLGYGADDSRIKNALSLARQHGLAVTFRAANLGDVHPNTVLFRLTGLSGRTVKVVGASIGGGNILITGLDDYPVELTGMYPSLVSIHHDEPGVLALITGILAKENVNIAFMRVSRQERGTQALAVIEVDQLIPDRVLAAVREIPAVERALSIPPLQEGKTDDQV